MTVTSSFELPDAAIRTTQRRAAPALPSAGATSAPVGRGAPMHRPQHGYRGPSHRPPPKLVVRQPAILTSPSAASVAPPAAVGHESPRILDETPVSGGASPIEAALPPRQLVVAQQMIVPLKMRTEASWQPPKNWKPAGPARLPYSQPWQRQGQVALDNCVKHIAELKCLLEERTRERDHNLSLAKEANEMLTALGAEKSRVEQVLEATRLEADAAREEALKAVAEAQLAKEDLAKVTDEKCTVERELQQTKETLHQTVDAKEAVEGALREQSKARALSDQQSMRAQAESAAAMEVLTKIEAERAAEKALEEQKERDAEEAAQREEEERQVAELERRRKALLALEVKPDTRQLIDAEADRHEAMRSIPVPPRRGFSALDAAASSVAPSDELTRFTDPEEIFTLLEPHGPGGRPFATLMRASWLLSKRPPQLPASKADLPPEAFITVSELRKIYRQTKMKQKLLPIISVLHPNTSPLTKYHPDEDGAVLEKVCEALDNRWDQFTRKRGTGGDSGVADLGIFFDWVALDERRSKETLHDGLGLWYAHELTTVWVVPDRDQIDPVTKQLSFSNGWATLEYHISTFFKSASDLSGYLGPWPQLLIFEEEGDLEGNEQVHRPSPCEPLAFRQGHQHGDSRYAGGAEERIAVEEMYRDSLLEMLGASRKLTFNRLAWNDADASRLALVLPLAPRVRELHLASNQLADQAIIMLMACAERPGTLCHLEVLNLSSNRIGDPGASRLSGAFTDGVLKTSLRALDLGANRIGDNGALTLAACISGGAIEACKRVNLKGNPLSVTAKKQVAKCLRKRRKKAEEDK